MAFTVGPESAVTGALPQVYTFTITLHLDDKTRIEIPEMTYMDPSNGETVLDSAEQAMRDGERFLFTSVDCVREQDRKARELV
ncbi:hypothetical protein GCM10011583_73430 [Streptomyces camponoticapitis]|uniref:Uncharacterized protein n=1 Tax=Streptomyces camponoticapitis TaxID=1616125 RepID=A0ABQ2F0U0_9ACTN|nr:hypothetical protein [Streptomyces camponoticapitis]GGK30852.1 hypothetical protein GCM10011583_73430 [Streptomyces camponoticapitis]